MGCPSPSKSIIVISLNQQLALFSNGRLVVKRPLSVPHVRVGYSVGRARFLPEMDGSSGAASTSRRIARAAFRHGTELVGGSASGPAAGHSPRSRARRRLRSAYRATRAAWTAKYAGPRGNPGQSCAGRASRSGSSPVTTTSPRARVSATYSSRSSTSRRVFRPMSVKSTNAVW